VKGRSTLPDDPSSRRRFPMSQKLDLAQHLFVKNTHLGFDFISRSSNLIPQGGVASRNLLP
jgi:hypothetical protein